MLISFTEVGQEHYEWLERHQPKLCAKVDKLIESMIESPFTGLGQPEPLRHDYSGCWSRRINKEHRLVYRVDGKRIIILQCRYHYKG